MAVPRSSRALRLFALSAERCVRFLRSDTSPPSDVLHLSGMSRKKSDVGRNSKGSLERRRRDGFDGAASPLKARGARPSRGRRREPYLAHRAPRVPRETLDRSSVYKLAGERARCEGAPRGPTCERFSFGAPWPADDCHAAPHDAATAPQSIFIERVAFPVQI
ncbi:hypothetical protein T492DRAFT_984842 [Pavlovales sp. CCMP2436]|nr:hypothetical protein T492DRAFT_984842 [Pavlovales sp. CCMP2436]